MLCCTALGGVDGGGIGTHGAVMSGFLFLMGSAIVCLTKSESFVEGFEVGVGSLCSLNGVGKTEWRDSQKNWTPLVFLTPEVCVD